MNQKFKKSQAKGLNLARALSNPDIYTNVRPSSAKRSPTTWSVDSISPDSSPIANGATQPMHILNLQIPVKNSPVSKSKSTRSPKVCELNFHKSNRLLSTEDQVMKLKPKSDYSRYEEMLKIKENNSKLQKNILKLMSDIDKVRNESEKLQDDDRRIKELAGLIKKYSKENEELKKKGKIIKTKGKIEENLNNFKAKFSKFLSNQDSNVT